MSPMGAVKVLLNSHTNCAVTTKCNTEEGHTLGPQLKGAVLIAQRFQCRKCGHKKPLTATECIKNMIGELNIQRYY